MPYFPPLKNARTVKRYLLGRYQAVLLTDCECPGNIQYTHVLMLFREGSREPTLAVAAEVNALANEPDFGGGSHFLGVFPGNGHVNLGDGDEWADLETFTTRALQVAGERLGVVDAPQELPLSSS